MDRNRDKDLDKFFQDKMNNRRFEYQDEYWTEMQSLLSDRSVQASYWKRNVHWITRVFFFLGMVSISTWFAYSFMSDSQVINEKENPIETIQNNSKDKSKRQINTNEQSQILAIDNLEISLPETQTSITDNIPQSSSIFDENITLQTTKAVSNSTLTNTVTEEGNITIETQLDNNVTKSIASSTVEPTVLSIEYKKQNENPLIENTSVATNKRSKVNNVTSNNELATTQFIDKQLVAMNYLQKIDFTLEETPNVIDINRIEPICDGCPQSPNLRQFNMGITAGVLASQVWDDASNRFLDITYEPTIGIRFDYLNSPIASWTVSAELVYWSRTLLNSLYEYETTTYSFGSTTRAHQINIQELHYLSLPLYSVYKAGNHQFVGGVNLNYIVNSKSTTTGNATIYSASQVELVDIPSERQWGFVSPFNRFDVGLTLGYDYQINDSWKVGGRFHFGFVDIKKDDFFNANTFENNVNVKLSLTHDIFNFKF
jgi:hypothetical protein